MLIFISSHENEAFQMETWNKRSHLFSNPASMNSSSGCNLKNEVRLSLVSLNICRLFAMSCRMLFWVAASVKGTTKVPFPLANTLYILTGRVIWYIFWNLKDRNTAIMPLESYIFFLLVLVLAGLVCQYLLPFH